MIKASIKNIKMPTIFNCFNSCGSPLRNEAEEDESDADICELQELVTRIGSSSDDYVDINKYLETKNSTVVITLLKN